MWMVLITDESPNFLTGFHPNVGKTFPVFALSVLKVLILPEAFIGKTFVIIRKSGKLSPV